MHKNKQKFNVNLAQNAKYQNGMRDFFEYRDLGINDASHGDYHAHIIKVKAKCKGDQDMHTSGFHKHLLNFQMVYILQGWIKFIYEGEGEFTFKKGDCVMQPAEIKHNELSCSDDLELLEIHSPAKNQTIVLDND